MKLNLLIRTYIVENLHTSLFSLPNVFSSDDVDIYVHNDNPIVIDFNRIIEKFQLQYPDYNININQEKENQDMFMSYLNSIEFIDENNYWTMLLDDDDTICNRDILDFLESNKGENVCVQYAIYNIFKGAKQSTFFHWHRIYPTNQLKKIFENKDVIVRALLKHNKSTKFNKLEDELMFNVIQTLLSLKTIVYKKETVNHNLYTHEVNGYKSENLYNSLDDLKYILGLQKIITNIVCDIKNDSSAIHK